MNPMQLKKWLESGVSAGDVDALRECVERYPYFGPLRMMLAKASDQAQDLDRRNDLLKAGAHVPSQRALLAYLMGDTLLAEAKAIHAEVLATDDVTEEDLVHMVWHAQGAPSEASDPAQPETAAGDVEASGTTQPPASRDELVSAIASVIEHEVQSWEEPTDVEGASASDPSNSGPEESETTHRSGVPVPESPSGATPTSLFGMWLQQRAKETGFGSTESAERGAAALIDAFLAKGDVRIGPIRDSLESTEEWAKQSLVEDPSLVTETMAKLYASQGQLGRARKAYKLLSLKYPEKSVYFAAQLKKLRNT